MGHVPVSIFDAAVANYRPKFAEIHRDLEPFGHDAPFVGENSFYCEQHQGVLSDGPGDHWGEFVELS